MSVGPDNVFFAQGAITVSQTRFVSDGDTYAMASISSCRSRYTEHVNDRLKFLRSLGIVASLVVGVALAIVLFGAVEAFGAIVGVIVGIAGAVASFIFIKPAYRMYHLYLGTNSGEMRALSSRDQNFIQQVERAINDAMVARG